MEEELLGCALSRPSRASPTPADACGEAINCWRFGAVSAPVPGRLDVSKALRQVAGAWQLHIKGVKAVDVFFDLAAVHFAYDVAP